MYSATFRIKINVKITSFKNFSQLTNTEKLLFVNKLRWMRTDLLKKNVKKKKTKKTKQKKPIKFESPELEAIFNTMSPACKKLMEKAIRHKEKNK